MRITDVFMQNGGLDKVRKVTGTQKAESKSSASSAPKADSLNLSKEAQSLSQDTDTKSVSLRAQASPDVRQDRIQDVQQKIDNGFYNTSEFTDKLAERLMNDIEF